MRRQAGFNLIELVSVIVIISALAVFLLPRINPAGFDRYAFREELIGAAQYAQKLALGSGCDVQLSVDTGGYALRYRDGGDDTTCGDASNAFGTAVRSPNGGNYERGAAPGLTDGDTLHFQYQGRPSSGATFQFDDGGHVIIEAETGYVHQ